MPSNILKTAAMCALLCAGCAQLEQRGAERAEAGRYAPARASEAQPDCFRASTIRGYTPVDRDTVRVSVGRNDYYDITVTAACPDLEWDTGVTVVARSSNLCVSRGAGQGEIVTGNARCPILDIAHSPRMPATDAP